LPGFVAPGAVYQHNWHIDAIAWQLERVMRGECTRLIITVPPRSLKSVAASTAFPAWLLGHDPSRRILAASYTEVLSEKLALDCQKVLEAAWYRDCFPATRLAKGRKARTDFETTRGGGRFSTSVGGTVTGRGGDIVILDDPHKPDEAASDLKRQQVIEWYRSTLLSRLNDPVNDPIILIQQRVHEADLAGTLLEQGGWEHLNLPAIAEEPQTIDLGWRGKVVRDEGDLLHAARLPRDLLDRYREDMGSYLFSAQYQQRPAPIEGGLVKWKWFKTYDQPPPRGLNDQIVQSWDTAIRAEEANDYSVCTTWQVRGQKAWLLDLVRVKLEFPELQARVLAEAQKWQAGCVLLEFAGSGIQLHQQLHRLGRLNIIGIPPIADKATRLMGVSPMIQGGRVAVPVDEPWLAAFRRELTLFPNGKHDDQVDSLSQFLNWWGTSYHGPLVGKYNVK
jgi:predicted phage terminase large subunit-like protein